MDSDFAAKLQTLLSNPDAMSKITAIASSMGMGKNETDQSTSPEPKTEIASEEPTIPVAMPSFGQTDPRIALLNSIKPLLREEKRGRVDSLLNALTVATMLKAFKK